MKPLDCTPFTEEQFTKLALYKARGHAWPDIAAYLKLPLEQIERVAWTHEKQWERTLTKAERHVARETIGEVIDTLRKDMRHAEPKLRPTIANSLTRAIKQQQAFAPKKRRRVGPVPLPVDSAPDVPPLPPAPTLSPPAPNEPTVSDLPPLPPTEFTPLPACEYKHLKKEPNDTEASLLKRAAAMLGLLLLCFAVGCMAFGLVGDSPTSGVVTTTCVVQAAEGPPPLLDRAWPMAPHEARAPSSTLLPPTLRQGNTRHGLDRGLT